VEEIPVDLNREQSVGRTSAKLFSVQQRFLTEPVRVIGNAVTRPGVGTVNSGGSALLRGTSYGERVTGTGAGDTVCRRIF
jgi:hypothetical protein